MAPIDACHLAGFGEDVASLCPPLRGYPPTLPPCRSATDIGYTSKNYLKRRETQLAIQPIVGG